jgi:hypothetical protein
MKELSVVDRVIVEDGFVRVRYFTPREYEDLEPYLAKTKINERVDLLNSRVYAEALRLAADKTEVKYPHCYGVW